MFIELTSERGDKFLINVGFIDQIRTQQGKHHSGDFWNSCVHHSNYKKSCFVREDYETIKKLLE